MAGILDGKIALITGAGSGIGRATARIFAREGARLVLADVVEAGGNETLRMIKESGADGIFVKCDVANEADVDATVARAVAHYGRLDCAFNNAGIGGAGRLTHEYSLEEWNRVIAINLTGVWLCMRAEIMQMLKQKSGAIVNTSSIMGLTGAIRVPAYTAAKHGVAGLTQGGGARICAPRPAHQRGLPGADLYADAHGRIREAAGHGGTLRTRGTDETHRPARGDRRGGRVAVLRSRLVRDRLADAGRWRLHGAVNTREALHKRMLWNRFA